MVAEDMYEPGEREDLYTNAFSYKVFGGLCKIGGIAAVALGASNKPFSINSLNAILLGGLLYVFGEGLDYASRQIQRDGMIEKIVSELNNRGLHDKRTGERCSEHDSIDA